MPSPEEYEKRASELLDDLLSDKLQEKWRFNGDRARFAVAGLACMCVMDLLNTAAMVFQASLYNSDDPTDHGAWLTPEVTRFYEVWDIYGYVYLVVYIVTGLLFVRWNQRAIHNLQHAGKRVRYDEGWAFWGWIIPIANIWIPYQMMRELASALRIHLRENGVRGYLPEMGNFIAYWWMFWLLSGIGSVAIRYSINTIDFDDSGFMATLLNGGLELLSAVTAALALLMVRRIAAMESLGHSIARGEIVHSHLIGGAVNSEILDADL